MGIPYAIDYVTRFGFDKRDLPQNLTLALGTVQATPLQVAAGYAVFANGGFRVYPYFIDRIENAARPGGLAGRSRRSPASSARSRSSLADVPLKRRDGGGRPAERRRAARRPRARCLRISSRSA